MRRTFSVSEGTAGINIDAVTIYENASGEVEVTFSCKYAATAQASTDLLIADPGVEGHVTASGALDSGISLKYFIDDTFRFENNSPNVLGWPLFAMVEWEVTSLTSKVGFYIKQCRVEDTLVEGDGVPIVSQSCYAKAVGAKPLKGTLANKFVTRQSQFSYNAFSFNPTAASSQKLTCEVEFCVINQAYPYEP